MYCSNCGHQINDNALFCESCGTKTSNHFSGTNHANTKSTAEASPSVKKEYVVQYAERGINKCVCIFIGGVLLIIFAFSIIPIFKLSYGYIADAQHISAHVYQSLNDEYYKTIEKIGKYVTLCKVISCITMVIDISSCIPILRTKLYFTNKRLVGNTGSFFGDNYLNIPLSQILETKAKKTWIKSGTLTVKTLDGKIYDFFIKNPYSFAYNLYEEKSKNKESCN